MANPLNILGRMLRRNTSSSAVLAALSAQAIGQPLMVEPGMGERLIGAYLAGSVDAPDPVMAEPAGQKPAAQRVAVLNITGALVDRPQPGLCDPGPVSYEEIRQAFDASLADDSVSAIVFRMRSPGGMVSGCFDLSDHVFASRGRKPIIAVADDYAYSACYALAAACDELWVSRTGGVGSVGVVAFHFDQSGYDAKVGVKVTPIFAGDRKVDFSAHAPLSEQAMAREQAVIDDLYGMFVAAVARYRDVEPEAVRATQALTYHGQKAIDAGMADRLGTFREALASLVESDEQRAAREAAAAEAQRVQAEEAARASRGAAAVAVAAAGLPGDLAAALLDPKADLRVESVEERIAHARAVVDLCVAAGDRSLAHDYIVAHTSIEAARRELMEAKAAGAPELQTTIPARSSGTEASGQWATTIAKFGGK